VILAAVLERATEVEVRSGRKPVILRIGGELYRELLAEVNQLAPVDGPFATLKTIQTMQVVVDLAGTPRGFAVGVWDFGVRYDV
jgi:hypothetical protein